MYIEFIHFNILYFQIQRGKFCRFLLLKSIHKSKGCMRWSLKMLLMSLKLCNSISCCSLSNPRQNDVVFKIYKQNLNFYCTLSYESDKVARHSNKTAVATKCVMFRYWLSFKIHQIARYPSKTCDSIKIYVSYLLPYVWLNVSYSTHSIESWRNLRNTRHFLSYCVFDFEHHSLNSMIFSILTFFSL